jgi:hypothetical protein
MTESSSNRIVTEMSAGANQTHAWHVHVHSRDESKATSQLVSNFHTHLYHEIYTAIQKMTNLSEDSSFFIPKDVAKSTVAILDLLYNAKSAPPQIINEACEALILTWRLKEGKAYISVDEDDVDYLELRDNNERRTVPLSGVKGVDVAKFISNFISSTPSTVSDANFR